MKIAGLKPFMASLPSAIVAASCCVIPLAAILLGIGSGAFMMYAMKYSYIFIPIGVTGVSLGYYFYFREKKKCKALACRMAGGRLNLISLIMATAIVLVAIVINLFPGRIAQLLAVGS
jgi:mercuric ion transport protein